MVAALEPFFTFRAGIPPHRLGELTVGQIAAHVSYWDAMNRGDGG